MRLSHLRAMALAGATAGALVLGGLGATAASAGTGPAGDPGVPSHAMIAQHGHGHGLRPEFFTIYGVNDNPAVVRAFGPVRGTGTDNEKTPTLGVFSFTRHGQVSTVNVLHTDVNNVQPQVSLRSCTAAADARGHWLFDGGTGRYRHVFGFGAFRFHLFLKFARDKHGHCRIGPKTQPAFSVFSVVAWGRATLGHTW
jgi:hypothetical protein